MSEYKVSDPRFWAERNKPRERKMPWETGSTPRNGNKFQSSESSTEQNKYTSDAVYEFLADALFDKISFISFPFTKTQQVYLMGTDGVSTGQGVIDEEDWVPPNPYEVEGIGVSSSNYINYYESDVTDHERYWGISRIPNTSDGKFLNPNKRSRMRCSFYVTNGDDIDGYILSPVVYDSYRQLNFFTSMDIFRSYVGLKFYEGKAYVAVKEANKDEVLTEIDIDISGSSSSTTYRLDMVTTGKQTTVSIDNVIVGTFPTDLIGDTTTVQTFLPLLSPAKRSTEGLGYAVGITIENFQFIQNN